MHARLAALRAVAFPRLVRDAFSDLSPRTIARYPSSYRSRSKGGRTAPPTAPDEEDLSPALRPYLPGGAEGDRCRKIEPSICRRRHRRHRLSPRAGDARVAGDAARRRGRRWVGYQFMQLEPRRQAIRDSYARAAKRTRLAKGLLAERSNGGATSRNAMPWDANRNFYRRHPAF